MLAVLYMPCNTHHLSKMQYQVMFSLKGSEESIDFELESFDSLAAVVYVAGVK